MKLNSIQVLRTMAALLVVYAHAIDVQIQFSVSYQQHFFYLGDFGAIGVDLFFVISGFIITYVADQYKGTKQGLHFLAKRFKRINPVYYLASLIAFGVYVLHLWKNAELYRIRMDKTLHSIADTLFILPPSGAYYNPLLALGWTLGFEWLFYLLFFLTILSGTRYKPLL